MVSIIKLDKKHSNTTNALHYLILPTISHFSTTVQYTYQHINCSTKLSINQLTSGLHVNKSMIFLPIQYSLMPPFNETCSPMNMLVLSSSTFASCPPALAKTQNRIHILVYIFMEEIIELMTGILF